MRVSLYDLPIIQSAYRIPFRIVMHYVSLPQAIHPFSVAYQPARFTLCHWGPKLGRGRTCSRRSCACTVPRVRFKCHMMTAQLCYRPVASQDSYIIEIARLVNTSSPEHHEAR